MTASVDGTRASFEVTLPNFSGPFDLLLSLISKHEMEITEVALAIVTDDFLAIVRNRDVEWDLSVASEFLVVAAKALTEPAGPAAIATPVRAVQVTVARMDLVSADIAGLP